MRKLVCLVGKLIGSGQTVERIVYIKLIDTKASNYFLGEKQKYRWQTIYKEKLHSKSKFINVSLISIGIQIVNITTYSLHQ